MLNIYGYYRFTQINYRYLNVCFTQENNSAYVVMLKLETFEDFGAYTAYEVDSVLM